jgi:hypothetical protein
MGTPPETSTRARPLRAAWRWSLASPPLSQEMLLSLPPGEGPKGKGWLLRLSL